MSCLFCNYPHTTIYVHKLSHTTRLRTQALSHYKATYTGSLTLQSTFTSYKANCSMVRGRLQRNYHICIRRTTHHKCVPNTCGQMQTVCRPQAYCIGRANTRWRNIMTGGLLETRAVTLPRTIRFAPGTMTLSSRREGSGWYTVL